MQYVHINTIRHGVGVNNEYYCTANFKSDSLCIRIGIDMDPGWGMGFRIFYKNGKFYTLPFSEDGHLIFTGLPKPIYEIREQELTLDKDHYNVGDSLYGHIYFHITETYKGIKSRETQHYANGFFRGKIANMKYN